MKTKKGSILKRSLSIMLSLALIASFCAMPVWARNDFSVGNAEDSLIKTPLTTFDLNNTEVQGKAFEETFDATRWKAEKENVAAPMQTTTTEDYYGTGGGRYNKGMKATVNTGAYITPQGYLYLQGSATAAAEFDLLQASASGNVNIAEPGKVTTVDFKFMLDEIGECPFFYYMGYNRGGMANYAGIRMEINSEGKLTVHSDSGNAATAALKPDKWYNMKIVLDFTGVDSQNVAATNAKQSIYINGSCIAKDIKLYKANKNLNYFTKYAFYSQVKTPVYFDDFRIYTEPTGRTTYSAENFSGYSEDVQWQGNDGSVDSWWEGFEFAPFGGESAKIDATNGRLVSEAGSTVVVGHYAETTKSKKLNVSFDYTPTNVSVDSGTVYVSRDQSAYNSGVTIRLMAGGILQALTDDNGYVTLKTDMKSNQTYKFTICTDISENTCSSNNGTDGVRAGHYSVYVDGECVGAKLKYPYSGENYKKSPNLGRPFEVTRGATAPTSYYDNFVVYTDEREYVLDDAFGAVKESGETLKGGINTFSLPTGSAEYPVAWTSSSDAIAINGNSATVTRGAQAQTVTLTAVAADADNAFSITRTIDIEVPGIPAPSIGEIVRDGNTTSVTATLQGAYDGTQIIAAVYDSNYKMLGVDMAVTDGTTASATVRLENLPAGTYTTRLFVLDSLKSLKPIIGSTDKSFVIE